MSERLEGQPEPRIEGRRAVPDQVASILESISDAFFAVDRDWRFIYVNARAEELWGRPREGLLGKNIWREFPQAEGSEARRQIEREKAQERSRMLAAIVESSEDAILSKTLDGTITSWNGGAERLYGYRAEEVLGKPVSILVQPELPREIPEILEKIGRGQKVEHFDRRRTARSTGCTPPSCPS